MVNVRSFQIAGVRCWFWSNDHEPPHFHIEAEDGDWNAKVFFLLDDDQMIQDVYARKSSGIPTQMRKVLYNEIGLNRIDLLMQWEDLHREEV